MIEIWAVVLIGAIGAFMVLVVLFVIVCAGACQEPERLTGAAPTWPAAIARRATGLHVITPQLPTATTDVDVASIPDNSAAA
jgi:hypothetical protein